ncbi:unnamed protein product [Mytilus coruscus]|uniref:Uncharacterized protein n=1 Tax=Mytilus coruscus TaxID=42192 RepID=A0A6J8C8K7_MYTCO|nr:unnamed protein product [Mytilus coruscus]
MLKSFLANTVKNTNWGINTYDAWGRWRNEYVRTNGSSSSEQYTLVPPLNSELSAEELDFWLTKFVVEVKRQDGTEYPADSLRLLCTALWRHLRDTCRRYDLNPFNKENPKFATFQHTLDGKMKDIERVNPHVPKRAEPITAEEENKLWIALFCNYENDSKCLSYAVYFYNCKLFALRAADEHSDLEANQYTFGNSEEGFYLQFQGKTSKNCQGGIYHKKAEKKCLRQYENTLNSRCVVKLFQFYLSVIPSDGAFYRRPIAGKTASGHPKFSRQKIGIHTIQGYMKDMCKQANVGGRKTGHSGKVTTATMLFRNNFDEQLIKERTGHKIDAVRTYKRTSEDQVKRISDVLQPPADVKTVKPTVLKMSEPQMQIPVIQSNNEGSYIKFSKGDVYLEFKL